MDLSPTTKRLYGTRIYTDNKTAFIHNGMRFQIGYNAPENDNSLYLAMHFGNEKDFEGRYMALSEAQAVDLRDQLNGMLDRWKPSGPAASGVNFLTGRIDV